MNLLSTQLGQKGRRVAFTAAALLFERVVRMVVGLGVAALVARHLGPGSFGALSYGLALGAIGAGIAQLGMDSILIREFARRPAEAGVLLVTSAIMRFVVAAIGWVVLFGVFFFLLRGHEGTPSVAIVAVLSLTSFQAVGSVPMFWMQTHGRAWQSTAGLLPVFFAASALRLVFVWRGGDVIDFGWIAAGEVVVSGIVSFVQMKRAIPQAWQFSRDIARELIAVSWPLGIATVAFLGYTRLDQLLLSGLAGEKELGIYAAALRLTEQGYLLPAVLATPMLGLIVAAGGDKEILRQHLQRYAAISAMMAYGFVAVVWLAAPAVFRTIFGHHYEGAVSMARIQVLAAPFIAVGYARNLILISEGRTRFALLAALSGVVVNIALNLLLIPIWGGEGASWAGLAAQFVSLVLSTWWNPALNWVARIQMASLFQPWLAWKASSQSSG